MAATQFHLVTEWRIDAPVTDVWSVLVDVENWPAWWRAVKRVELLEKGDASGIGVVRRLTWSTALPYDLSFDFRSTRIEPLALIEGRAFGELDGTGRWTLRQDGETTHVRYDWIVEVTKTWMVVLAPLLRPVFTWNHNKVMEWGHEGLLKRLGK